MPSFAGMIQLEDFPSGLGFRLGADKIPGIRMLYALCRPQEEQDQGIQRGPRKKSKRITGLGHVHVPILKYVTHNLERIISDVQHLIREDLTNSPV